MNYLIKLPESRAYDYCMTSGLGPRRVEWMLERHVGADRFSHFPTPFTFSLS